MVTCCIRPVAIFLLKWLLNVIYAGVDLFMSNFTEDVGYFLSVLLSPYTALNISTGPLALRTFQTAGPVRASTLYLSLALQDHRVKCRASRLKITVARSMTNFATFSCNLFLKFRYVCIA